MSKKKAKKARGKKAIKDMAVPPDAAGKTRGGALLLSTKTLSTTSYDGEGQPPDSRLR